MCVLRIGFNAFSDPTALQMNLLKFVSFFFASSRCEILEKLTMWEATVGVEVLIYQYIR